MTWIQRPNHVPIADSNTTEYRYCLDALIATIADMRESLEVIGAVPIDQRADYEASRLIRYDISVAEERAADLAHQLFERWIEDRELSTGLCYVCNTGNRPGPHHLPHCPAYKETN